MSLDEITPNGIKQFTLRKQKEPRVYRSILTANLDSPVSRLEMVRNYCRGKDVLDIGCVQHDACNAANSNWLHQAIVDVAGSVLGIDYLKDDIDRLNALGYRMIAADVTKPLDLSAKFDVIVVGNLIEHLTNFEGLLNNVRCLLKSGGCVLISTANPFYREQYFYSAFKNDILVNPEHTCWIDPVTLDQLCRRFDLATDEVQWIREKWNLGDVILNGKARSYDMFTGKWVFHQRASLIESAVSNGLEFAFKTVFPRSLTTRIFEKYGSETRRLLYLKFVGGIFQGCWSIYRAFIISSPINTNELFVSVLRPIPSNSRGDDQVAARPENPG